MGDGNAIAHVKSSFNNTIIVITTTGGDKIGQCSAGAAGFRGSRKSTPHAAKVAAGRVAEIAKAKGVNTVLIKVQGPGPGRESAIRELGAFFAVTEVWDVTGVPHNGCRAEGERRV